MLLTLSFCGVVVVVCKVIFVSNPTAVLRLCCRWGCDNTNFQCWHLCNSNRHLNMDCVVQYWSEIQNNPTLLGKCAVSSTSQILWQKDIKFLLYCAWWISGWQGAVSLIGRLHQSRHAMVHCLYQKQKWQFVQLAQSELDQLVPLEVRNSWLLLFGSGWKIRPSKDDGAVGSKLSDLRYREAVRKTLQTGRKYWRGPLVITHITEVGHRTTDRILYAVCFPSNNWLQHPRWQLVCWRKSHLEISSGPPPASGCHSSSFHCWPQHNVFWVQTTPIVPPSSVL